MSSNEILDLILKELRLVQERAERLRTQVPEEGGDATATKAMSAHIEGAVQNIRELIRDFEQLERDKSA